MFSASHACPDSCNSRSSSSTAISTLISPAPRSSLDFLGAKSRCRPSDGSKTCKNIEKHRKTIKIRWKTMKKPSKTGRKTARPGLFSRLSNSVCKRATSALASESACRRRSTSAGQRSSWILSSWLSHALFKPFRALFRLHFACFFKIFHGSPPFFPFKKAFFLALWHLLAPQGLLLRLQGLLQALLQPLKAALAARPLLVLQRDDLRAQEVDRRVLRAARGP